MSRSGLEALSEVREALSDVRVFWRPSQMSLRGGRPFQMSGSCLEALSDVREALPAVREWWEALPDDREALRMPGSVWDALPYVWEWSGGPPGCSRVVWRPSRMSLRGGRPFKMSGSCREALPDVPEGGRQSRLSGSSRKTRPDVREWWEALPDVRDRSGGPPGCSAVVRRPSRMCGSGRVALPDIREWLRVPTECP